MFNKIESLIDNGEKSIVEIDRLVEWKRTQKRYNFDKLPSTAILTVFPKKSKLKDKLFGNSVKGLKGSNFLSINKKVIICTDCSFGAPYIVNLCEELRALGVSKFIFVGMAGAIDESISEGELLFVEKAFSGVGTSYYYSKKDEIIPIQSDWCKSLCNTIEVDSVSCWSTDAPFRETKSLKEFYLKKDAKIVDMEFAALYAFTNYYKLEACCLAIVSDQLTDNWSPPKNYPELKRKEEYTINKILNYLDNIS